MGVKDVYGKEVSEQNHMILAHSPTSMLIEELKRRKMSDREIMDSKPNWTYPDTKVSIPKKDEDYMPNQYKHRMVSFAKSVVRILGFGVCWWSLDIGVTLLILAEVIGVAEELV